MHCGNLSPLAGVGQAATAQLGMDRQTHSGAAGLWRHNPVPGERAEKPWRLVVWQDTSQELHVMPVSQKQFLYQHPQKFISSEDTQQCESWTGEQMKNVFSRDIQRFPCTLTAVSDILRGFVACPTALFHLVTLHRCSPAPIALSPFPRKQS